MFEEFLYTLRQGGLKVSLTEWMSLMEALDKGAAPVQLHRLLPPVPVSAGEERGGL